MNPGSLRRIVSGHRRLWTHSNILCKADDRMLIGVPGKTLKLLVDIDGAEVGIEGESTVIQRFDKDHTGASISAEEKSQQRTDARNLLGRLWMAYDQGKLQI